MKFIRGLYNLTAKDRHCVATIGNFDGMHLGHQALLQQLKQKAKELKVPAIVILFELQPNEYFGQGKFPPRLMRLREKLIALQEYGIDHVLCLRFDDQLAQLTAEEFIQKILVAGLAVKHLVIGDDFRFGQQRQGDLTLLQSAGKKIGFTVGSMSTFIWQHERVSSTRIRKLLETGDLEHAAELLGRPFMLSGRVAHGDKRGRIIGFPTANIFLHRKAVPLSGVFAVKVYGLENKPVLGVANIGNRPTFNGTRCLLEVHLFDFAQEIYGRHINVEFSYKLRDEKRYDSFELLKQQIFRDAQDAKDYFRLKSRAL